MKEKTKKWLKIGFSIYLVSLVIYNVGKWASDSGSESDLTENTTSSSSDVQKPSQYDQEKLISRIFGFWRPQMERCQEWVHEYGQDRWGFYVYRESMRKHGISPIANGGKAEFFVIDDAILVKFIRKDGVSFYNAFKVIDDNALSQISLLKQDGSKYREEDGTPPIETLTAGNDGLVYRRCGQEAENTIADALAASQKKSSGISGGKALALTKECMRHVKLAALNAGGSMTFPYGASIKTAGGFVGDDQLKNSMSYEFTKILGKGKASDGWWYDWSCDVTPSGKTTNLKISQESRVR